MNKTISVCVIIGVLMATPVPAPERTDREEKVCVEQLALAAN